MWQFTVLFYSKQVSPFVDWCIQCVMPLLYTKYLCAPHHPTPSSCWNPNPQWDALWRLDLWEVVRSWGWSPHVWNECPGKRCVQALLCLLPSKDREKGRSPMKQEAGPYQTPNLLESWSWTSQPSQQWQIHVCSLRHPVYGIFVMAVQTKTAAYKRGRKTLIFRGKW